MKIVYIVESLVLRGGCERIVTEKANFLADKLGYDISIIVCSQHSEQQNAFSLSNSVKQINLGLPLYSQYQYKYPMRLWIKKVTTSNLRKSITDCVHAINPDILIGMGHFKANIICNIDCRAKKIIECHEARFFTQSGLANHQNMLSKLFTKLNRLYYFHTIEKKADVVVTLTEGDKCLWNKAKHVEVIPNFSDLEVSKTSLCNSKRIIAVGRLSWEKGYDRLIEIWELVIKEAHDWYLDIYGEGDLEDSLIEVIRKRKIKNIRILPTTNSISQEYSKSSICVMTSYFEGFALVLLEALKHGVPCIAFDCPFGPASIIQNGRCGFTIKNGDTRQFVEKLSLLIHNEEMRKEFSLYSIKRASDFSIDSIMKKWVIVFESLL